MAITMDSWISGGQTQMDRTQDSQSMTPSRKRTRTRWLGSMAMHGVNQSRRTRRASKFVWNAVTRIGEFHFVPSDWLSFNIASHYQRCTSVQQAIKVHRRHDVSGQWLTDPGVQHELEWQWWSSRRQQSAHLLFHDHWRGCFHELHDLLASSKGQGELANSAGRIRTALCRYGAGGHGSVQPIGDQ